MADLDKRIEKAIKPIVKMYSDLETELMIKIAEHFKINEEFINSDFWKIQKLDEMGAFNKQVLDYLSKYTKQSPKKIKQALQEVYNATIDFDTLRSQYKNGKILISPNEILKDARLLSIMENAYNEETRRFIQMSQLIENSTRRKYLDIVEKGYLATSTGIKSYDEAIRESLNELADKGIDTLDYVARRQDGSTYIRSYDVEGTIRREILTASRQLSGNLNNELIEVTNCKYVRFSEHLDCRPTHFDWQGTIVEVSKWKEIAEYGEITGIYGINCRHYVEPYFGDAKGNELKEYSKEKVDKAYKESQKQRYLERGIRAWKRRKEVAKASGDSEMYKKSNSKVKEWSDKLDTFTNEHNRKRDYTREYVSNMNDSLPINKNKKEEVLVVKNKENYEDLTDKLKNRIESNKNKKINVPERRLEYALDKEGNKYYNYYFDPDKDIIEELEYQKLIEKYTGYKTYLNPKTKTQNVRTPDFWIEDIKELWDIKGIDGEAKDIINNILHKASKQTHNIILKQRKTSYSIDYLKEELTNIFVNNKRKKIKQVILLDKYDNVIKYYKR